MKKHKATCMVIVVLSLIVASDAIMRPVYKVALTQVKNAQYLQYDLETPAIKEFTFCVWLKLFVTDIPQFIFTYIINGHRHLVFWLEKGGNLLKLAISGKTYSSFPVNFTLNIWNHVCMTYQSNYGAWAVYLDREFLNCGASQDIMGLIFPGGGSIIVGHGMTPKGDAYGVEGEIYGVNMILRSSEKVPFTRNKLKSNVKKSAYIVFKDLALNEFLKVYPLQDFRIAHTTPNIHFTTLRNEYDTKTSVVTDSGDLIKGTIPIEVSSDTPNKNLSNLRVISTERTSSSTPEIVTESPKTTLPTTEASYLPLISVFETPPPPSTPLVYSTTMEASSEQTSNRHSFDALSTSMSPPSEPTTSYFTESWSSSSSYSKDFLSSMEKLISMLSKKNDDEIPSEIETPPPIPSIQDSTKYYGQWSDSDFAHRVLIYLRNMNFRNRVPSTIPLSILSDSLPYASTIIKKMHVPAIKRRKFRLLKRSAISYNIKALSDWRENIQLQHSGVKVRNVEVTSRGETKDFKDYWQKQIRDSSLEEQSSELTTEKDFDKSQFKNMGKHTTGLPFLKPLEYFLESPELTSEKDFEKSQFKNLDIHTTGLPFSKPLQYFLESPENEKWLNISPYSKPYIPRQINMDLIGSTQIYSTKNKMQTEKANIKCSDRDDKVDDDMIESKEQESNNSSEYTDVVPQSTRSTLRIDMLKTVNALHHMPIKKRNMSDSDVGSFNRMIKIGNALNEWSVIGLSHTEKSLSFVDGDDSIPDINKHRSDIDDNTESVPPSLLSEACRNFLTTNRLLPYVQKDINYLGIQFITMNFDRCSYENVFSPLFDNVLFINWENTPVRLYGGAQRLESVDLCSLH